MRITHSLLIAALSLTPLAAVATSEAAPVRTCKGLPATIVGTAGDDELIGTPLDDVVWLGPGDDRFTDTGGNDVICGGPGNDTIAAGAGSDYVDGEGGHDKISGEEGDDWIVGGDGKDEIFPGAGNDRVEAGKGDDYIAEAEGNDRINGGPGTDYVTYLFQNNPIRVKNAREVTGAGRDVLTNVETIEGSAKADVIRGSAGKDDLRGGGGNDRIYGLGGDDVIFIDGGMADGGPGVDFIQASGRTTAKGGPDSDQIVLLKGPVKALGGPAGDTFKVADPGFTGSVDGQGGANQLDFSVHKRAVTVNIGKGRASWKGGHMRLRSIHNTLGTTKGDTLIGSNGNDYLNGLGGNDTLRGLGGSDFLIGDKGRDFADGGAAFDICMAERTRNCP